MASGKRGRNTHQLELVRIDADNGEGLALVFDAGGVEHSWLLGRTSVVEIFALLLKGRMQDGRRVTLHDVEVSLEPPEAGGLNPSLCISAGEVEICVPVDRPCALALKADLEQSLKLI